MVGLDGRKQARMKGRKEGRRVGVVEWAGGWPPLSFVLSRLLSHPFPSPLLSAHTQSITSPRQYHMISSGRGHETTKMDMTALSSPVTSVSFHAQGSSPWEIEFRRSNYTHTHTTFQPERDRKSGRQTYVHIQYTCVHVLHSVQNIMYYALHNTHTRNNIYNIHTRIA